MGAISDPKGRGITVTIKYGKGYEDTWAVFHGPVQDVREDIIAFFGMPPESETGLTLSDLVVNATSLAHGIGNVAAGLGATVIASEPARPASPAPANSASPAPTATQRADPWTQASTPAATTPEPHPLLALIEQAPDVRALERLWAENQDAFTDPAVTAAWKARGRALSRTT